MRHIVMVVHDLKARAFITPFFVPTAAVGVRAFRDAANDPAHAFYRNPSDYALFELGVFDDSTGQFACGEMVSHGLAAAYFGSTVRDALVESVVQQKAGE